MGAYESLPVPFSDIYLPLIIKNYVVPPDLVITSLAADSGGITVTVKNQGNSAVVDAFWLDVYFNPARIPVLNEEWEDVDSDAGAVWGVTAPIPAGDSLTLTLGGAYFDPSQSSNSFPDGAKVYGYVDSINYATSYGNVWESNENNNLWPGSGSAGVQAASGSGASTPGLPGR